MKIGIMQPYFFPYIGYWQLINVVDKYVIYDDVNYIKGGWINRNRILIKDKPSFINLKMDGSSPNKLIKEIQVSNDNRWKSKFLKTIELSYKKAPFFEMVYPIVEEIVNYDEAGLSLYLENSIKRIAEYLDIKTEFILSSNIKKNNSLRGQDKVLEISKCIGASEYYNAIGGVELYSPDAFEANSIKLKFLRTEPIVYKQFNNDFVSNLSIIDVMMFNSKEEIRNILGMYSLI